MEDWKNAKTKERRTDGRRGREKTGILENWKNGKTEERNNKKTEKWKGKVLEGWKMGGILSPDH